MPKTHHRRPPVTHPADCRSVADAVRQANALTGAEHVGFVDHDWVAGPAGMVDLFLAFSTRAGRSIGMREALFRLPDGSLVGVYLVPLAMAGPFVAYLDVARVDMPDGSVVIPVHGRAGAVGVNPRVAAALDGAHLIGAVAFAADDPRVVAMRADRPTAGRN